MNNEVPKFSDEERTATLERLGFTTTVLINGVATEITHDPTDTCFSDVEKGNYRSIHEGCGASYRIVPKVKEDGPPASG